MAFYESVFIARQDISNSQVETIAAAMQQVITDNGGKIEKQEYWGLRNLAYRIKKNRKGHYVLFNIDAPAPAVHEMERQLRLHEDVLRTLTVKVDALEEGPSVVMQSRSRDERGGRGGRGGRDRDDRGPRGDRDGGREDRGPRERVERDDQE